MNAAKGNKEAYEANQINQMLEDNGAHASGNPHQRGDMTRQQQRIT